MGFFGGRVKDGPRPGEGHQVEVAQVGGVQDQGGDEDVVGGRSHEESAEYED